VEEKLELILLLLGLVSVLAVVASWLRFSYPILLVVAGLLIGLTPGLPDVNVNPEAIFLLVLPPLLYSSAFLFPWRDLRANIRTIFLLAIGLVLATTAAVGFSSAWLIPGMTLAAGFVLGAIVSPPDAVAATAVLKKLPIPRRVLKVLEGESLVNDASGLVAYQFAVAALVTGVFSASAAAWELVWMSVGGVGVGLVLAWLFGIVVGRVQEPVVETTASIMNPFVVYLVAESIGVSGILAVVACGLYVGHHHEEIYSGRARLDMGPIWRIVQHLLEATVFVLIGLEFPALLKGLEHLPGLELLGSLFFVVAVVVATRFAWIFSFSWVLKRIFIPKKLQEPPIANRHLLIMSWCGMRGVVSLAAALAIPRLTAAGEETPGRDLILFLTFGVIFFTLVTPTLTLPALVRRLGMGNGSPAEPDEGTGEFDTRVELLDFALARLPETAARHDLSESHPIVRLLAEHYVRRRATYADRGNLGLSAQEHAVQLGDLIKDLTSQMRMRLRDMARTGRITEEVRLQIRHDLDADEQRMLLLLLR
jgi:Na+/H+ antiporter